MGWHASLHSDVSNPGFSSDLAMGAFLAPSAFHLRFTSVAAVSPFAKSRKNEGFPPRRSKKHAIP